MNINKIGRILLALTLLLVIGECYGQKNINSGSIKFPSNQPGVIKVMTFNIRVDSIFGGFHRWKNRKENVVEILKNNAADIVALQEALYSQTQDIQQSLPQYSNYAIGRNNGKQKGESCAIFFKKDRFQLVDSGTFWFSDTPSVPGSKDWGNMPPRICSWVRLKDKKIGSVFYVYNVHLDAFSQNSREKSTQLLLEKIAARKTQDPFIVMGDFNMEMDNPAMEYLQKSNGPSPYPKMADAWQSIHSGQGGTGTRRNFMGGLSGNIDHIPVSEHVKVLEVNIDRYQTNGGYASDHFPVVAKLIFEKQPNKAFYSQLPTNNRTIKKQAELTPPAFMY